MNVETRREPDLRPESAEPPGDAGRAGNLVGALVAFVMGAYVAITSIGYGFGSAARPGAGVFPFAIGSLMAGLALAWTVMTVMGRTPSSEAPSRPERQGVFRIVMTMVAAAGFVTLVDVLGYQLTMSAVIALLLATVARVRWWLVVTITLVMGIGSYALFVNGLGVSLPAAGIPALRYLGL
ncbi:hypothetical protein GCM10009555_097220 [Acrocarpospora macrocephala]|uniref:DUF1468 domain-containing protein n=1 Tax=Acrocarpospora macrocephala TaxID=150177 RepID=A0A5M3X6M8_9ACTN|nr:tripartite tricarboxylate transporter TctB family protein [Acrocarpospora macrocephala]GES16730.1 hypothetical protein Amac_103280 [Acrocarpospora macrocephala]